ncbi:hypothetical protein [Paenibacillus sp. OAS669]|uniref:hypothetical protein n=1 Tax=Paenibacillus sp. OAS669 TaxID=2663821 RepID=UPI001789B98D|nr:hypothetical protein [Paenibacillus sp. OAS669]MBE1442773.1 hypothetical protein [Paenibacillus sp. OAS669]
MYWDSWSINRVLILFVSLAFLLIGIQVTMSHYRQNFHHKAMWMPVIASPLFLVTGLILTWYNLTWLHQLFIWFMWIGAIAGLLGFYFHFHGVGVRVGGWSRRNFLVGPPIIMPLMFTALNILGLIALYWKGR